MNLLSGLHEYAALLWSWHIAFYRSLTTVILEVLCIWVKEFLEIAWSILGGIPIPDELMNFVWPDPGPLGGALIAVGVPEAMILLGAAFTIKLSMSIFSLLSKGA